MKVKLGLERRTNSGYGITAIHPLRVGSKVEIRTDFMEEVALELRRNNRSLQASREKALLHCSPGDRGQSQLAEVEREDETKGLFC